MSRVGYKMLLQVYKGWSMVKNSEHKLIRFSREGDDRRRLLAAAAYSALIQLNREYPDFSLWYASLFRFDNVLDADREMLLSMCGDKVAGIAILKRSEQKVCTLRVVDGFRGRSVGTGLLRESCELLGTSTPLITVSSAHLREYQKLFKRFGFKMEDCRYAYYSMLHSECAFNGSLDERALVVNTLEFMKMRRGLAEMIDAVAFPSGLHGTGDALACVGMREASLLARQ